MNVERIKIQNNLAAEQIKTLSNNTDSKEIGTRLDNLGTIIQSLCDLNIGTNITDTLGSICQVSERFESILLKNDISRINYAKEIRSVLNNIPQINNKEQLKFIDNSLPAFIQSFRNSDLIYFPTRGSYEENVTNKEMNSEILDKIFSLDQENDKEKSAIITLSPVNDKVLKYLSENPLALYRLADREFEIVMAEIYDKLGYEVELTKATHDGGKDIIIRKPEILGDFIYYVECKKNAAKRHIG